MLFFQEGQLPGDFKRLDPVLMAEDAQGFRKALTAILLGVVGHLGALARQRLNGRHADHQRFVQRPNNC
ncbi:hypothetical protein [Methylobacterium variabile]|mgnify:CR=1 FL=1|uniref:hypothetical protein n=1 Tax=Methylobacterium variabile TaxID=298794 RepID=UPI0012ECEF0A|nr:hypothetical protein [Methylobacterium variabile]